MILNAANVSEACHGAQRGAGCVFLLADSYNELQCLSFCRNHTSPLFGQILCDLLLGALISRPFILQNLDNSSVRQENENQCRCCALKFRIQSGGSQS